MATHLDRRLDVQCKRLSEHVMGAALCANEIIAMVRESYGDRVCSAEVGIQQANVMGAGLLGRGSSLDLVNHESGVTMPTESSTRVGLPR